MARIGIKEFYRKIIDRIKGRIKKKSKCNWPELDLYCGCCKLSTGIYIRSSLNLLVTVLSMACNTSTLNNILGISPVVYNTNLTIIEGYAAMERTDPGRDLSTLYVIYNGIIAYYVLWLCYKVVYVVILLWTIFAVFKRNGKMMKLLLYISVPNFILDVIISFLAALIIKLYMRILVVLCVLSEGYNILALNSEYKNIMGKSRVRHKDVESEPRTPSMPPFISPPHRDLPYVYNQVHCRGCNCTDNGPPDTSNGVVSIQPSPDPLRTTLIENKEIDENELNYAMTGILNTRNTEEAIRNETDGNASGQRAVRPNTLDLTLNTAEDEKVVITDEPVIYDVNQLNVGNSPVIEDREKEA